MFYINTSFSPCLPAASTACDSNLKRIRGLLKTNCFVDVQPWLLQAVRTMAFAAIELCLSMPPKIRFQDWCLSCDGQTLSNVFWPLIPQESSPPRWPLTSIYAALQHWRESTGSQNRPLSFSNQAIRGQNRPASRATYWRGTGFSLGALLVRARPTITVDACFLASAIVPYTNPDLIGALRRFL